MLTDTLTDDLQDIGYDPGNYEAPRPPTPPARGTYLAKLTRWQEDTDKATGALRTPYQIVASFEIVDGPNTGRFFSFQRISSRGFNSRAGASMLNDLLAVLAKVTGHEGTVKGRAEITTLLNLAKDTNAVLKIRTDWDAYDKEFIAALRAEGKQPSNDDYNTAKIRGQAKFGADGTVVGPSGTTLTAQGIVTGFSA